MIFRLTARTTASRSTSTTWTATASSRRGPPTTRPTGDQQHAERTYWDLDRDGFVSDDERDEDADGLTNYDEVSAAR